jgi:hypothetical protein
MRGGDAPAATLWAVHGASPLLMWGRATAVGKNVWRAWPA